MKFLALSIVVAASICLYAQDREEVMIPAGSKLMDVLTPAKIYHYPNFVNGQSFFKDGSTAKGRLNYNILNEEVEFINSQGDTMGIAKDQMLNIKYLQIDTTIFYYNNGYIQKLKENTVGKLLSKQFWVVVKRQKIGGYGEPTSTTAAIFSYTFYNLFGTFTPNLVMQENITLAKKTIYYFGNLYNLFLPANKKNYLKLYPGKKTQFEDYLKKNQVNFSKFDDVEKVFDLLQ